MVLGFLDRIADIFRSEKEIAYRRTLDHVIKGHLNIDNTRYELDPSYRHIRQAYYDVFRKSVSRKLLSYKVFSADEAKSNSPKIEFYGHNANIGFKLEYTLSHTLLNLNFKPNNTATHNIKGNGWGDYMNVITFYTQPNLDGKNGLKPKTFIRPGEYFGGKLSSKTVDDSISNLFYKIWTAKNIPGPSHEEIKNIPDYEKCLLNKSDSYIDLE